MVITMMTKKQLMQALAILEDDDTVLAVYKGKYTAEIDSWVSGVKIMFKGNSPKAVIMVNELDEDDLIKAA